MLGCRVVWGRKRRAERRDGGCRRAEKQDGDVKSPLREGRLTRTDGACGGLCAGDIDVPTQGACVGVDGYGAGCSNMRESAKSAIFNNSPQWETTGRMR